MSAIKFRKRLTKFMITIALSKKFGSKALLRQLKSLRFEVALANRLSLDMYTPYEVHRGISPSMRDIDYTKTKIVPFINVVETVPLGIDTIVPRWLEHLWDHGNLFEIWVVQAT